MPLNALLRRAARSLLMASKGADSGPVASGPQVKKTAASTTWTAATKKTATSGVATKTTRTGAGSKKAKKPAPSAPGDGVSECSLCSSYIVDGEEDALFCEGECNGWMHRYCAGVPLKYFERLSSSSSPFFCYACAQRRHEQDTADLKEKVNAMAMELEELRRSLQDSAQSADCSERAGGANGGVVPLPITGSSVNRQAGRARGYVGNRGRDGDGGGTRGGQESLVLLVVVLGSIEVVEVVVWEGEEGAEEGGWVVGDMSQPVEEVTVILANLCRERW